MKKKQINWGHVRDKTVEEETQPREHACRRVYT